MVETNQPGKRTSIQRILLLLAMISSPLLCCSISFVLNVLPVYLIPPELSFMVNLFKGEVQVGNKSGETLYITPMTTTTGRPAVIRQPAFIRQRDIPLQPGKSVTLTYDHADMPLSGIVVCRTNDDCRLWNVGQQLTAGHIDLYPDSFQTLPKLEPEWQSAIRSYPFYNFEIILLPLPGLVPVVLFSGWLSLVVRMRFHHGRTEKK